MKSEQEYEELLYLRDKINDKKASFEEEKEYIRILANKGEFTQEQYEMFAQKGDLQKNILFAALTMGGVILASWLFRKLVRE
ncbi:MAG: hypothetical protein Q3983_05070 [Capnocytophaga sp.]|nr:hypothetical protein [Capnocytophaga sp.]